MVQRTLVAIGVGGSLVLAGCAAQRSPQFAAAPRGLTCNSVKGNATTFGEAAARGFARQNAAIEARDLRGDFVRAGFKRVRVAGNAVVCQPYALTGAGSGVYNCVAAVRVCGL